jgi:hypothetical protein
VQRGRLCAPPRPRAARRRRGHRPRHARRDRTRSQRGASPGTGGSFDVHVPARFA